MEERHEFQEVYNVTMSFTTRVDSMEISWYSLIIGVIAVGLHSISLYKYEGSEGPVTVQGGPPTSYNWVYNSYN